MGAAMNRALGTVRCGSRISRLMNDAASGPVQQKASVVQKMTSAKRNVGVRVCRLMGVAGPKRHQLITARATNNRVPSQRATAPALLSHFATAIPRTLRATDTASTARETPTKY